MVAACELPGKTLDVWFMVAFRGLKRWDEGRWAKGSLVYILFFWWIISYTPASFIPPLDPFEFPIVMRDSPWVRTDALLKLHLREGNPFVKSRTKSLILQFGSSWEEVSLGYKYNSKYLELQN